MAEGELSPEVIILIVILGAAGVTACGYGMHRALATRMSTNGFERKFNERNAEQDQYMVDLRMAHRNGVMADARPYRPGPASGPGPRYSHESSSYDKGSVMESRQEQHGY